MKSHLVGAVYVYLVLFALPALLHAEVVDQYFEPSPVTNYGSVLTDVITPSSVDHAQTFTVGTDGLLTRVDVLVRRGLDVQEDLKFDIRTVSAGIPDSDDGSALASAIIPWSIFPPPQMPAPFTDLIWVSVDLSVKTLPVIEGQEYALVLQSNAGPVAGYEWGGAEGNQYTDGSGYFRVSDGAWTEDIGAITDTPIDWGFRTHLIPTPPAIDINPGKDPNIINLKSGGSIPVAVLTQGEFDALQLDPVTTRFGPGEAATARYKVKDVDKDHDVDLVLFFKIQQTGITCSDVQATLTGELYDGTPFTANDSIQTKNCQ